MRHLALTLLFGAVVSLGVVTTASWSPAPAPRPDANPLRHEPVLVLDVTGTTLLGIVHRHLAVYNDGYATLSAFERGSFRALPTQAYARTAFATESTVAQLRQALGRAGAFALEDQRGFVTDVPLTTVTIFRGGTNAVAHTYSYWLPTGDYGGADAIVHTFLADHFPDH